MVQMRAILVRAIFADLLNGSAGTVLLVGSELIMPALKVVSCVDIANAS